MSARCSTCPAEVLWVVTDSPTPKRMPLDAQPADAGNVILTGDSTSLGVPVAHVLTKAELADLEADVAALDIAVSRYVSHFATCPNARAHRRRR